VRDDLDTAVERLFEAFRSPPLAGHVEFCDHCVDPAEVEELRVTPLRDLTPDQLGPLLFNAMSTWGDAAYFMHFLPRLLELVAGGAMEDWSYPSFLPARMASCWDAGTEEQRKAIDGFLLAWWTATLSRPDQPCRARDVLEVIDGCVPSVTPFLDMWSMATGEVAVRQFADFVVDWGFSGQASDRLTAQIDGWLRGAGPAVLLDQAAGELGEAADSLAVYRSLPTDSR
jgi:hypothetical protein